MIKLASTVLALLILAITASSSADEVADEIVHELNGANALEDLDLAHDTRVAFVETTYNALLRRPVDRHGELWREDDTLIMEMAKPRWEQRRLSATRATLVRPKQSSRPGKPKEQRLSLKLDTEKPAHVLLIALRAALMGDASELAQHMTVSNRVTDPDNGAGWLVSLQPKIAVRSLCGLELRGSGSGSASTLTGVDVDQCGSWQRIRVLPDETAQDSAP